MFTFTNYSPFGVRGKVVGIPGCKGNVFPRENKIFWRKIKEEPLHLAHTPMLSTSNFPLEGGILDSISNHEVDIKKYRSYVPTKDYA